MIIYIYCYYISCFRCLNAAVLTAIGSRSSSEQWACTHIHTLRSQHGLPRSHEDARAQCSTDWTILQSYNKRSSPVPSILSIPSLKRAFSGRDGIVCVRLQLTGRISPVNLSSFGQSRGRKNWGAAGLSAALLLLLHRGWLTFRRRHRTRMLDALRLAPSVVASRAFWFFFRNQSPSRSGWESGFRCSCPMSTLHHVKVWV